MHRLASDEIFHFYLGDPVEMLQLLPDGSGRTVVLGNDLAKGQHPQLIVEKNVWQGSRLVPGGQVALLGCTVSPGFDYADYETGKRDALVRDYGQFAELITSLTRHKLDPGYQVGVAGRIHGATRRIPRRVRRRLRPSGDSSADG